MLILSVISDAFTEQVNKVKDLILSEVNVKEIEYLTESGILVKKIKPDFKALGPKYGKMMKQISSALANFSQDDIAALEANGNYNLTVNDQLVELTLADVDITTQDIPGWVVANEGKLTVALDITLTEDLKNEGHARELVNKIQNIRKDQNFDVTDKIVVTLKKQDGLESIVKTNFDYICSETLTEELLFLEELAPEQSTEIDLTEGLITFIKVEKKQ